MARPEGYRKATRLMELAGRFGLPLLSLPIRPVLSGRGAEERARLRNRDFHSCLPAFANTHGIGHYW